MALSERGVRRKALIGGIVALVLVAGGGVGAVVVARRPSLPRREVAAYLEAWQRFDAAAMGGLVDNPPPELAAIVAGMKDDLQVAQARFRAGPQRRTKGEVQARFTADLDLAGLGSWSYQGTLHLVRRADAWRVVWSPSALHPDLGPGQRFERSRTWAVRAPILGADGAPLAETADVVVVGLEPDRIRDQGQVEAVLQQQLEVPPADVRAALAAPEVRPSFFVPVASVRPDRFSQLRPVLEPVPGVFFQRGSGRLSPSEDFASHVLGAVGEVTAERLAELKAPYLVGDRVGLSGLEATYERQLAGQPSGEVRAVDENGEPVRTLHQFAGVAPQPLRVTLDRTVQQAAERALSGVTQPAALVALDAATGDLRAVASRPLHQFNRALAGRYPPGSTFKVVTTAALLASGTRPDSPVACPPQATVGGQRFVNFEGEALGAITFRTAFAESCNTAFVALADGLPSAALTAAAKSFGFGAPYDVHLPAAGGQFPAPGDAAERASQAIGQGRVLASPLHMASVAAAVASGSWHPPRLVADDRPGPANALDPAVVGALRDLMAEVVRTGTGTAAAVPGQAVAGKTGTAEVGGPDPNLTHAWFIGFRGPLAFAVLVEEGGVGGRVAAPLASRFLAGVPS